jgi:CheY-like chemotaxis protein
VYEGARNGSRARGWLAVTSRLRVLVVDDDDAVRASLCRLLRRHHYVHDVADGAAVVPLIESGASFDAILMDLDMPIMNGREALHLLTRVAPAHAARTLLVTGGARTPELHAWLDGLPAHRVHRKPVDMPRLLAAIGRVHQTPDVE